MRRRTLEALVCVLTLMMPVAGSAQKLPEGKFQPVRERTYDLLHYKAELEPDLARARLMARATIVLEFLRPTDQVALDAVDLEIEQVRIGSEKTPMLFSVNGNSLRVELPREWQRNERLELVIDYSCSPRAGMYFETDLANPELASVFTYGEGGLHANWLPIYGDVNDKFSTEMVVSVPEPYVVVSNGRLVETRERDDGKTTYHWLQNLPHSNYLIAVYIADFEEGKLEPALGEIPQSFWVPRGRLEEGEVAFRNTARMVEYFSELFDYPYPWAKHDQIALPGFGSAMEHTGVTLHHVSVLRTEEAPVDFGGPDFSQYYTDWTAEATISHELAHQWFGNNLTCRSLGHLWLNESFASYLMMLWAEESVGEDELLFAVELARRHYLDYVAGEHIIRPLEYHYFDDPTTIYNEAHTYLKGAAILHMLRRQLGDEAFFSSLADYLRQHEFSNVESRDLKTTIEGSTGLDLEAFFDDWITGAGHPVLEVRSRYLEDLGLVDLEIRQVQPWVEGQDLFRLQVPITLATTDETWTETVWLTEEKTQLLLPAAKEPVMISVDGGGDLVAEIRFDKEPKELAYQALHDRLPGRLRALRQLAERYPTAPETLEVFGEVLTEKGFWAISAEAAQLLGEIRTPDAEKLLVGALAAPDYRVRKAAVLALPRIGPATAVPLLTEVVEADAHSDIVATAIVALAKVDGDLDSAFLERQLQRDSWYDEIRIASLKAFEELGRAETIPTIRPFTQAPWNLEVRRAALRAWRAARSTDPELHAELIALAETPSTELQPFAVEALGKLYVEAAVPLLEEMVEWDGNPDLTVLAAESLKEIERIR